MAIHRLVSRLFFFSLSLPLMTKQPNYNWMLKNLLKLYCIRTWDTLWGFFFLVCFVCFCSILFFPFDGTTTEQHLRHHLQVGGRRMNTKIIKTEITLHLNWRLFLCFILFFIHIFLLFTCFLFLFLSLFYLFFIFNSVSFSLMAFQPMVD
jgi:hypothetical protein